MKKVLYVIGAIGSLFVLVNINNACSEYAFQDADTSSNSQASGAGANSRLEVTPLSEVDTPEEIAEADERYNCDNYRNDDQHNEKATAGSNSESDADDLNQEVEDLYNVIKDHVENANYEEVEKECRKHSSGKKVLVCHVPPGNPENAHEVCVSIHALRAHLGEKSSHLEGYLGECIEKVEPSAAANAKIQGRGGDRVKPMQ